jgi:hypothetical protein
MAATPNILAKPRFWTKKLVLVGLETTYGVDPVLTGLLNWYEARNVSLKSFDAKTVDRNIEMPYFGNGGTLVVSIWSSLTFDIALAPSGVAGTAPKWAPLLLASGFAETLTAGQTAAYNLVSENVASLCAYLNIDGGLYKFQGARVDPKIKMTSAGIPLMTVELNALYLRPVAADAVPTDTTGWQVEEAINSANTGPMTIAGVDMVFSDFNWACGNTLTQTDLPGPQREVQLTDRKPTADCTVLAPSLTVFDPYAIAESNEVVSFSNTHGSVVGKRIQTDLKASITNVEETNVDGVFAYKLTLSPKPVNGNDEIALTCK